MILNTKEWSDMVIDPDSPIGFYFRDVACAKPITSMLEVLDAGTTEGPHHHPHDDMSVMIEGQIEVQFYVRQSEGKLETKGDVHVFKSGETAYIPANQIHSVDYVTDTKMVYVQDGEFGFIAD
jgi:oxalate decarboxylase/phosphoglucose isomerase-like protein (cupin superfamily)